MIRRRLAYAAVLLAAVVLTASVESYFAGFLLAVTVALPPLAFLLSLPAMLELRIQLTPQAPAVLRGGEAMWRIQLDGRYGLPVSRTDIRVRFVNRLTGAEDRRRLRLNSTPAGSFLWLPADTAHCGVLEGRVTRIRVCDCLGLFALRRSAPPAAVMQVLPLPAEPDELPEEGRGIPVPRRGGGPGEDYEVRPYRPGDPVRMLHWKLTSKRDEPMLREVMEVEQEEPLLTFDHFGPPEALDRVFDRLAALSGSLVERRRPHHVQWLEQKSGALRNFRIESRRDLDRCLSAALSDAAPPQGVRTPRGGPGLCVHLEAEDAP